MFVWHGSCADAANALWPLACHMLKLAKVACQEQCLREFPFSLAVASTFQTTLPNTAEHLKYYIWLGLAQLSIAVQCFAPGGRRESLAVLTLGG